MMNPFSWLQMTNMISYQGLVRTFPESAEKNFPAYSHLPEINTNKRNVFHDGLS
jgi:hypothetical protein